MKHETAKLLGEFAEKMNDLGSNEHPELDESLAKHPDNKELQNLSKVSRVIWGSINKSRNSPRAKLASLVAFVMLMTISITFALTLTYWIVK